MTESAGIEFNSSNCPDKRFLFLFYFIRFDKTWPSTLSYYDYAFIHSIGQIKNTETWSPRSFQLSPAPQVAHWPLLPLRDPILSWLQVALDTEAPELCKPDFHIDLETTGSHPVQNWKEKKNHIKTTSWSLITPFLFKSLLNKLCSSAKKLLRKQHGSVTIFNPER